MRRIDCWVAATAAGALALAAACGGDTGSRNAARVDSSVAATTAAAPSAAAPSAAAPAPAAPAGATISFGGLDSIRVGESVAAVERATGETFALRRGELEGCRYIRPKSLPVGVKVMVANDTVVRLDVDSGAVHTDRGIGVGSADSLVRATYGRALTVAPNKYVPAPAHDLIVTSPDDTLRRMIFESDGAAVTRFHVGVRPAVDLVEGCG